MIDLNQNFNDSYERINIDADLFYDEMYKEFMGSSDEIRELFAGVDMQQQKAMLKKAIFFLISFYATKKAGDYLVNLAIHHQDQLKIPSHHYDIWLDSLIKTVKKLDRKFNNHVELGWRITLTPGIEFMKHYSNKEE